MITEPTPRSRHGTDTKPAALTVSEACSALRVSKWTLYRLIRSRQLETIRIRRRRLIPLAALDDLVDRLRAEDSR